VRQALGPWLGLSAILAAVTAAVPSVAAVTIATAAAVAVWRWPREALAMTAFAVLAVRPSLDMFSERRLGLSEFAVNPAVVFGLAILWVTAVLALVRARSGQRIWPDRSLLRAHLALLAAYGIAFLSGVRLYGATGMATGVRELVRVASIVAAFLIVLWWAEVDPARYRRGWAYLVVGMLVPVATALWQWATGTGDLHVEGLNRLQGTFSHPNSLGPYLVPFILFAVGGLTVSGRRGQLARVLWAAALTVLLALTYSRTAVMVLLTGLIMLPVLYSRRFGSAGLLRALAVVGVLVALGWWLAGGLIAQRFSDVPLGSAALEAARTGDAENSFVWRLINWGGLVSMGLAHPFGGHGAGMTLVLNPLINQETGIPFNAHDDFVRFFFEGGILGLACYLLYGALLCGWVISRARMGAARRAAGAYAVAAAWVAMFFLTAGTPELSLQTAVQYELYGMAALLVAPEVTVVAPADERVTAPSAAS
jgi:O-antigen ligase